LRLRIFSFLTSEIKYYLIAFAPIAAIFFLIPFELYYNAREYWNFNRSIPIRFAATGLVIYAAVIAVVFLCLKIRLKLGVFISIFMFCLGTIILLSDVFSPLQASALDGTEIASTEPLKHSLIEGLILFAVVAGSIILRPRRLTSLAVSFTVFLFLLSAVYFCLIIISTEPSEHRAKYQRVNPNLRGNVYHVVLDEMQTDAALLFLEEEGSKSDFSGFTLFRHNMSNYLYTRASFASYITGSFYSEGLFRSWCNSFRQKGLLQELYRKGYRITMYSARHEWNNPSVAEFITLQEVYEEETHTSEAFYNDFTQIWLARITPNILSNEALSLGKQLGTWVYKRLKIKKSDNAFPTIEGQNKSQFPVKISEGLEPFSSVLMLNRLIDSENRRSPHGQYVYAHAILPHGPYIFSEDCDFDPSLRNKRGFGYYSQAKCALNLIGKFLDELKRLGRYDSSTIIIHSDTGHGHMGHIKKIGQDIVGIIDKEGESHMNFFGNPFLWNKRQVLARTMALLMIKPAYSSGNMKYSEKPSQLIDLRPTLADLLNLKSPKGRNKGIALFREDPPEDRESAFFLYSPEAETPEMIKITLTDPKRLWNSKLFVWGYKGKRSESGADSSVIFR